jgi:hypothetical protein
LKDRGVLFVMPAQAGIQPFHHPKLYIPAFSDEAEW